MSLIKDEIDSFGESSSTVTKSESTSPCNKFWQKLEALSGVQIPVHIKNILRLNNFDNYLSFCSLNSEMLSELEIFVKEDMLDLLEEDCNLQDYFGIYHKNPTKFRFLIGDKALLIRLVGLVNNKLDLDYWNPPQIKKTDVPKIKIRLSEADIVMEQNKLCHMIQNSLQNLSQKNYENDVCQNFATLTTDDLDIQVSIKENNVDTADSFTYIAKLKCILCSSVITMAKQVRGWIISNYIRHIHSHILTPDEKRQSKKRKFTKNLINNPLGNWDEQDDDSSSFNEQADDPLHDSIETAITISNNKKLKNNSASVDDYNMKQIISSINWPINQYKQLQC